MSLAIPFLGKLGRGGRPLRIAYARVFHEANAYSPLSTTREDFERMLSLEGAALGRSTTLRGSELAGYMAHAELTGFVQAARAAGDVTTIPLASRIAVPGGPLTLECFEWIVSDLLERIRAAGPLDGVYLALHGSMEVRDLGEPPETVILRRVRAALGPDAKIAVSFDLHANLSEGMVEPVDVLVAYRTNPHWDLAPTGFRAGSRLIRVLRGQLHPVHAWRKLPVVLGGGVTIDFLAPMRKVFRMMRKLEDDPRVVSASLFMVHPYTSAEDLGWAVHVSTDGDPELAARLADQLADAAWAEREVQLPKLFSIAEAIDEAVRSPWRRLGPVTLVDVDDIVGAGAPGGNTQFVAELARDGRGLTALVPVHDPAAIEATWDVPVGTKVKVVLRGTPGYGQPEVPLEAIVSAKLQSDFGRIVRLTAGTLHVAVSERPPLPIHPKFWRELGIDPRHADLMVQKNFFHYRIFYAAISFAHIPTVSFGATSFDRVRTRSYRVPMHPAAKLADWRPSDPVLRRPRAAASPVRAKDVTASL
jgi:microcystin degradation protein MlrC